MSDLTPPPLVSSNVRIETFRYMPLDIHRLLSSTTWIKAAKQGNLGHVMMTLWCEAFRHSPAGSLPNDDEVLAHLAMCDMDEWKSIKERALSGFVLCSDNRLYHPVVVEKVMACWTQKQALSERTKNATLAKKKSRENRKNKGQNST